MAQGDSADGQAYEKISEKVSIFLRDGRWYANYQQGRRQVRKSLKTNSKKEVKRKGPGNRAGPIDRHAVGSQAAAADR